MEWDISNGPGFGLAFSSGWHVLLGWVNSGLVSGLLLHPPPDRVSDADQVVQKRLHLWLRRAHSLAGTAARLNVPPLMVGPPSAQVAAWLGHDRMAGQR